MGAFIHHTDVKTAFRTVFSILLYKLSSLTGYEVGDPAKKVWRLKKALYGLVKAPGLWYETLNKVLVDDRSTKMSEERFFYVFWRRGIHNVIKGVYGDDFLLFGTSDTLAEEVRAIFSSRFKTTDLGPARWVLGMRLRQNRVRPHSGPGPVTKTILKRFRKSMTRTRSVRIPVPTGFDSRRAWDDTVAISPFHTGNFWGC